MSDGLRASGAGGAGAAPASGVREAPAGVRILRPEDVAPLEPSRGAGAVARPSLSYWGDAWRRLRKNRQAFASLVLVCGLVLFTVGGPLVWRVDPGEQVLTRISEGPGLAREVPVLEPPPPYEEILAPDVVAAPEARGADLPAPTSLAVVGTPTVLAVRLRWAPVPGAAGYLVYRSAEPPSPEYLGLPVGAILGGNVVSFEDTFNLTARTYHYAVLATNITDSPRFATVAVTLPPGVSIAVAQEFRRGAKAGESVTLPARPFGTDQLGRDLLARMMWGARVSLFIGFFAPFLYTLIGVAIGGVAGYFGGRVDQWIMRFTDFVLALPFLLFMILFRVAMGVGAGESGIVPMLVALIALSWTGPARLVRGQVLQLRESEFVQASRLLGAPPRYLLARHMLPNTLGVVLVSLTFSIPGAIHTEAFLSFIGMGVVPPTPSWGSMCSDGIQVFLVSPHEFIFPAAAIIVAVLAFNLLGDGLRDALDPKLRSAG